MRIAYVTHSLLSCWNHGNAHFLRGVLRALGARGHSVVALEPRDSWSRANLLAERGPAAIADFRRRFPDLDARIHDNDDVAELLDGADVVIVHEWTDPDMVAQIGRLRRHGRFTLLFHDTHHRAVSDPAAMRRYDLSEYDGVLAFGAALAAIYRDWGWGDRVFVWHEAADITVFHPPVASPPGPPPPRAIPPGPPSRAGAVWIGNWGDGERAAELETFLLRPAQQEGLALDIHGVRYPDEALAMLAAYGARYHGWLANAAAPDVFARHAMTIHVPRRYYTQALPGIPTIRVFEALACGIPLISAPWSDDEGLFRPGEDFLVARDGTEMRAHMATLRNDPAHASAIAASGLSRILQRHTCGTRADELLAVVAMLRDDVQAMA